ncbi:hypothetical protein [Paenibacillus antarcticus]|uniref:DUF3221 domain-containing protein n=1 Tax=Paenibacillus antarcticus TaxID=253703 RepID=A0A168PI19_9BACL|nr:hypothetical protein [Paenibacillus antarcticus]OAB46779.1 hypothetical protein PBAT_08885 [Paenibacillus antarcticus]
MKKVLCTTSVILFLMFGLVACGNEKYDEVPTPNEVIRDVEMMSSNILLGEATEKDEKFPLSPIIIDDWEVKFTESKATLDAEITGNVGDKLWISEERKTIIIHYGLNNSKEWVVQGVNINDPVVRVKPRIVQTVDPT